MFQLFILWFFWQVVIPLLGPIMISMLAVFLWNSGQSSFVADYSIVWDVSPWAMLFYSLVLLSNALRDLWGAVASTVGINALVIVQIVVLSIYVAFLVIWRHDPNFAATRDVYTNCVGLLLLTLGSSLYAHWKSKEV